MSTATQMMEQYEREILYAHDHCVLMGSVWEESYIYDTLGVVHCAIYTQNIHLNSTGTLRASDAGFLVGGVLQCWVTWKVLAPLKIPIKKVVMWVATKFLDAGMR